MLSFAYLLCQGGGVLDANSQLKMADFTGKGGCEKLMAQMGAQGGKPKAKANPANRRGGDGPTAEAWISNLIYFLIFSLDSL